MPVNPCRPMVCLPWRGVGRCLTLSSRARPGASGYQTFEYRLCKRSAQAGGYRIGGRFGSFGGSWDLGFFAGEGAGDWRGDLYALGKVLYEASTGMDRNAFPDLPPAARGCLPRIH